MQMNGFFHFVTTDGGYEFAGATFVKAHVADQGVRSDRLMQRFLNALDAPGMLIFFDPGMSQGYLQHTSDISTAISMKKTDIIVIQKYCHEGWSEFAEVADTADNA